MFGAAGAILAGAGSADSATNGQGRDSGGVGTVVAGDQPGVRSRGEAETGLVIVVRRESRHGEGAGAIVMGEIDRHLEVGGVCAGVVPIISVDSDTGPGIGDLQRGGAGTAASQLAAIEAVPGDVQTIHSGVVHENVGVLRLAEDVVGANVGADQRTEHSNVLLGRGVIPGAKRGGEDVAADIDAIGSVTGQIGRASC